MTKPQRLGRYELLEVLGKGAMGIVYRARDELLDRTVAVKTCYEDVAASTQGRQRFEREVKAAGRLHHPNIVVVFDGGIEGDTPYIAMELVNGPTLAAELEKRGKIPPAEAARLLRKIAEGLDYAHRNGVVHRDLKPANILLTAAGEPKISDFGVAKLLSADTAVTETPVGTPRNMSPEQVTGSPIDGRSDVFALGILAYEMLTGVSPFAGEHFTAVVYNILNREPRPPSELEPSLPPAVDAAVLRALSKDREHRTSSPLALADEIEGALGIRGAAGGGPARKRRGAAGGADEIELGASDLEAFRQLGHERKAKPEGKGGGLWIGAVIAGLVAAGGLAFALCGRGGAPPAIVERTPTEGDATPEPAAATPRAAAGEDEMREEAPPRRPTTAPTRRPTTAPTRAATAAPTTRPTAAPTRAPVVAPTRVPTAAPTKPPPTATVRPTETPIPEPTATPEPTAAPSAELDVLSEPLGAEIVVDGETRGKTPRRVIGLAPGEHELVVRKEGFLPYRQTIDVEADARYELNVKLASEVNSLRIVTDPPGATVRVGGSDRGVAPLLLDSLESGSYEIVVSWPNGTSESRTIELRGGELTEVRFRMTATGP